MVGKQVAAASCNDGGGGARIDWPRTELNHNSPTRHFCT